MHESELAYPDAATARFGYNARLVRQVCPRSMKVVQLICNHQVVVRFRAGAPDSQYYKAFCLVSVSERVSILRDPSSRISESKGR